MKKIISVLLSVIMLASMFAVCCSAVGSGEGISWDDAMALAQQYEQEINTIEGKVTLSTDPHYKKLVMLVFDPSPLKFGSVAEGMEYYKITSPSEYAGEYVMFSKQFRVYQNLEMVDDTAPKVTLPGLLDADDGYYGGWRLMSNYVDGTGNDYTTESDYSLPRFNRAPVGNIWTLKFNAVQKVLGETPVFNKIAAIFYKVAKVLLGEEVALKLLSLFAQLGVELEVDG